MKFLRTAILMNICERLLLRVSPFPKCTNNIINYLGSEEVEVATRGVLLENVFLEILKNSLENTCARVPFLIKSQATGNFIKNGTLALCFSVNFYRTPPGHCFGRRNFPQKQNNETILKFS